MEESLDRHIGPLFKIKIQGYKDRQIGPYFKIEMQESKDLDGCSWAGFFILVGKIRYTDENWSLKPVEYDAKKVRC